MKTYPHPFLPQSLLLNSPAELEEQDDDTPKERLAIDTANSTQSNGGGTEGLCRIRRDDDACNTDSFNNQ